MEAQQWCEKMENKDELANIIGKRQWFNVPPADIINRIKGDIDYGDGRKVTGSDQLMKFWKGGVSYPYQSHELWFLTENQRWGKLPTDLDTKAIIGKVNREDLWREAAKNIGVADADIPQDHVARQGNLLRRQGVRSRRSQGLSRLAADQEGGVMQAQGQRASDRRGRPRAGRHGRDRDVPAAGAACRRAAARSRAPRSPASCCRRSS